MKKLIMLCFIGLIYISNANAQRDEGYFKAGVLAGIPIGDVGDDSSFMLGAEVSYVFPNNQDRLFTYGLNAGLRNYFIDDVESTVIAVDQEDALFLPLSGSARVVLFEAVTAGVDLGYAFGLTDYLDGGFYFRPIVNFEAFDQFEINFSYESISDDITWSSLMIGAIFRFKD